MNSERRVQSEPQSATRNGFFGWLTPLVHRNRAELLRVARYEGLGAADAFDCVQESLQQFLLLPGAAHIAEQSEEAAKVLAVMVRNRARNERRLHAHSRTHLPSETGLAEVADEALSSDQLIEKIEEHARLLQCVDALAQAQRTVVALRMLDELPGETVAQILETTAGNVGVLLYRAKSALRACMSSGTQ